jgi:hypothetical protein
LKGVWQNASANNPTSCKSPSFAPTTLGMAGQDVRDLFSGHQPEYRTKLLTEF